jgi:prepilin-type N-terminal cleavage/methylation domain-containing protein
MTFDPSNHPSRSRLGLTLVECMVALAVLGAALLAIVSTATVGEEHLQESDHVIAAARLARDLLEEISSKAYDDPQQGPSSGPGSDETGPGLYRTRYDDIDDFNGYNENFGQIVDSAGKLYPADLQVFKRRSSVRPTTRNLPAIGVTVDGQLVVVTIEDKKKRTWQFTRFIPKPNP